MWLCECECGKLSHIGVNALNSGQSKSCGCYRDDANTKLMTGKPARGIKGRGFSAAMHIFRYYRANAKYRKLSFELTVDQFLKITKENCYYCNVEPKQCYKFLLKKGVNGLYYYNGIDRIKNKEGYFLSNCVPCCGTCNRTKGKMDEEEFLLLIKTIYNHKCI